MKQMALPLVFIVLMLSGCAAPQQADRRQSALPVMSASSDSGVRSPSVQQGGGYLPGDGPGNEPVDIGAIPDAVPKPEPLHRYANRPYSALGRTYTPLTETGKYKERGIASWYGKKFHGQRTASGEVYDMYGMTAAHPILPIPSYARVTNLANGRSVVVRINDRGPFLHQRIIDLSYAAAARLGFIDSGSAEVEVESIAVPVGAPVADPVPVKVEPLSVETPDHATISQVFLQLGAFRSREGAESFLARMRTELGNHNKPLQLYEKDGLTRVHLGPYASESEARGAADELDDRLGYRPFLTRH